MLDFSTQKVIPSLSKKEDVEKFIKSNMQYCILLNFDLIHLEEHIKAVQKENKIALVHLDYINGIAIDAHGCNYVINRLNADGILSANSAVILEAKNNKKIAIQRVFLVDTATLEKEITKINFCNPDYVELIPGIANEIYSTIEIHIHCNFIAGGLLKSVEQMYECIYNGASAVTVSSMNLAEKFHSSYND